ncbi:MAG: hypothetical protein KatS3mg102_1350 [Planctomycetota bacterium]|nr:MAG: hypothetical protein KatS3mg102_1350 [Planctomycetota bacterium]
MACHLKLLGPRPVRLRLEPGETLAIGRSPENDLCLDDKLVSRRHCELRFGHDGVLTVRDLGSRNGTFINGRRLAGEERARQGDQIKIGGAYLLVEGELATRPRTAKIPALSRAAARASAADAAAGASPPPEVLPALPGYELIRELGRGRTGRIFKARSLFEDRMVAIKLLDPRLLDPQQASTAIERFVREARALRRLDHPNIVRVFDVDRAGGYHYYTMELLEGVTLAERLEAGRLGVREALAIGIQVARALELAHAEDVIHRDVCPRNILISPGGVAKLFDFGAIKSTEGEGHSLTGLDEIIGELVYSSPEQVRDPRQVDHRTDLYALGATLYHAIGGRPPIEEGENYLETLRRVLSAPPRRLRELEPAVPPSVDELIMKLLSKEPGLRVPTAAELVRRLEVELLQVCGPEAGPGGDSDPGSFGGGFSGMELLEIVQFLEYNQKSGALTVSAPPLEGEIHLREGVIVSAHAGQLEDQEAVVALLSVTAGTFRFRNAALPEQVRDTGLRLRPGAAAIEAMRRRDEVARTA